MDRRNVLQLLTAVGIAPASFALAAPVRLQGKELLLRPQDFGAKVDGVTLDSPAINAAIDRAHGQGGGMVYLSPGIYLSGTVVLKSNVTLYIEAGAVILGSKDIKQYLAVPGQTAGAQKCHLILAQNTENVTLSGAGLIDGQGSSFWVPSGYPAKRYLYSLAHVRGQRDGSGIRLAPERLLVGFAGRRKRNGLRLFRRARKPIPDR